VDESRQGLGDAHGAAEFFLQLPMQCSLGGFTCFNLPAGKLPQAAKLLSRRSLRDHDALIAHNDGANDRHWRFDFHPQIKRRRW
jgi:hypothetical protein